jgi:hypothetical protein
MRKGWERGGGSEGKTNCILLLGKYIKYDTARTVIRIHFLPDWSMFK